MKKYMLTVFAVWLAVAGGAQALERTTGAGTSVGASSTDALVKTLQEVMNAGFADLRTRMDDMNTRMDGVENKLDAMLTCSRKGMVFNPEGENPDNDSCVKVKKQNCSFSFQTVLDEALEKTGNTTPPYIQNVRNFTVTYFAGQRYSLRVSKNNMSQPRMFDHGTTVTIDTDDQYYAGVNKTSASAVCIDGTLTNFFSGTTYPQDPPHTGGTDGDPAGL